MKRIRTAFALLVVAALAAATLGAAASASTTSRSDGDKNIVQTAVAAGQFTTLASLLTKAGLVDTLSTGGPFTVFAPTDAAFAKVPKATLDALGKSPALLKSVLLYHVVPGRVTAADVVKLNSAKTLEGQSLAIKVADGSVYVDKAKVTTPDVMPTRTASKKRNDQRFRLRIASTITSTTARPMTIRMLPRSVMASRPRVEAEVVR